MKTKEERKEYYKTDKWKKYHKKYYEEHPEKIKANGKKWREKNPEYGKKWYKENKDNPEFKEKAKAYDKKYEEEHPGKEKARRKKWNEEHLEERRESNLKKKYNLNIKDYNKILKQQGGVCAICRKKERTKRNGRFTFLSVDHDWSTKRVRGLLCKNCNTTLGNLKENIPLFYKCIQYLKKRIKMQYK